MVTARETTVAGPQAPGGAAAAPRADATAVIMQAASLLLDYPGAASTEVAGQVEAALVELPRSPARRRLDRFLPWWNGLSEAEREQAYVATFDLDRTVTLYVTERDGRTSRERGAALVDLRRAYREDGAEVRRDELPDYLPLMLEVAAHVPAARALLVAEQGALEALAAALKERESPFALVLEAVLTALPATSDRDPEERP